MNVEIKYKKTTYVIKSDSASYTLYQKKIYGKESEKAGEEYLDFVGYYSDIRGLFHQFPNRALLRSNAKTLDQLFKEFKAWRKLFEEHLGKIEAMEPHEKCIFPNGKSTEMAQKDL